MGGSCTTCGRVGPLQAHHVAGRANHPTLTMNVCLECHQDYLTDWQRAAGVELRTKAVRSEVDRLRALAVGAFHVLALAWQRECLCQGSNASSALLTARAFSRLALMLHEGPRKIV